MKILITGIASSGKTTLSKLLSSKIGIPMISEKDLINSSNSSKDFEYGSPILDVDISNFESSIPNFNSIIYDGFLFPDTNISYDFCILLKINRDEANNRMKSRGYSDLKIEDNLFCQDTFYFEDRLEGKCKSILILEDGDVQNNLERVLEFIGFNR